MGNNKKHEIQSVEEYKKYQDNFSETGFWDKVKNVFKSVGKTVLEKAFVLYYVWKYDKGTIIDNSQKAIIIGALGYFILPIDIIPDFIPGLGFADDAAALATVYATIMKALDNHPKAKKEIETSAQEALEKTLKD